ncbi:MAG: phytanoyl-CoA dioxygenase family protein, partial [Pyrinomonadaceae bacterium]
MEDLSTHHKPITTLFNWPTRASDWNQYRLTNDQIDFFHTNGYLAGIRVLHDDQIETLRRELAQLIDPNHPGHQLFYEFHSNESTDPSTVLF